MAAAVAVPTALRKGSTFDIVATGFTATHAISLVVTGADGSFVLHDAATTDGSGNFTWSSEITLDQLGTVSWSVTDGSSTVTGSIQVSS